MSINPKLPAQSYPLIASADPKEPKRLIAVPWYDSLLVIARAIAGLGPVANAATITGWGTSAGGVRGTVNGGFVQVAQGAYSQADTQTLINQVEVLSQRVAKLLSDLETSKILAP